jgi:transcriptional regulator with XRE-family HTH domain
MPGKSLLLNAQKPKPHPLRAWFKGRLTQFEIATALGVSYGALTQILAGYLKPSTKIQGDLELLAAELKEAEAKTA